MDAVSLQLEIIADVPKGTELTEEFLDKVVRNWAEDGDTPDGIEIKIIDWKREGKTRRPTDQDEARTRFRGLLQAGRFTVRLRSGRTI
jgi:hypothetical protein